MKPVWSCLLLLAVAQPALAAPAAPYYGPMKAWHGWGYKFGYRDDYAEDGSWRIDAATRWGEAIDVAMYRAAERAQAAGYDYIEFLGASASTSPGYASATVYARPSHSAAAPAVCRSGRVGTCYTADVAEVMRRLGGADGRQPGVATADHVDEFGRQVFYSGFGIGAVSAGAGRVAPAMPPTPTPVVRIPAEPAKAERYAALLSAAQPVHGRDARQGWTVSD